MPAPAMTMPAWPAQRPVWRPVSALAQIPRVRFQLPSWRKKTCPGRERYCVFSLPLQLRHDAGVNVLQTHHLLRHQSPEVVRRPVWAFQHLPHLGPARVLNAQAPWRQIPGVVPSERDLQPLSRHCAQRVLQALVPLSTALPAWKRCRPLYRAGRANYRDYLAYYLIPDPSGSHQTLTSHRQVLRPRC